jgi:hypothetical protein
VVRDVDSTWAVMVVKKEVSGRDSDSMWAVMVVKKEVGGSGESRWQSRWMG